MAATTYTTDDLISDVLLLGHVPTGNNTFTDSTILQLANMELLTPITKQILSTRGGYYLTYADYTVASNGLYMIPGDAIGGTLANVELVQGPTIIQVNIIVESEQFSTVAPTSTCYGAFMKGNYVQILPIPNVGTVRLWYFKRVSQLIQTSQASAIAAINSNTYTVSSLPSTITVGSSVDVVGDQPPFNLLSEALTVSAISGTDVTLSASTTGVAIGDWIAPHGQTPIPQIPVEFRLILAQRVVCKIYELQGYLDKLQIAKATLAQYEADVMQMISRRIKSQSKIISPVNGGFWLGNPNRVTNFPAGSSGNL